jgi:uncharacterized protein
MNTAERCEKDLEKTGQIIAFFEESGLAAEYPAAHLHAKSYLEDARHYFEKKDYFASFGCANYAYGMLDGLIISEKGDFFHALVEK